MSDVQYPMFDEIIAEIKARPEADPAGVIEEYIGPLANICNEINDWVGANYTAEDVPEWYERFVVKLARFDVDLSPIWSNERNAETREVTE